ncbi:MAG: lipoyl synthase [Candidatus Aminicenantes bacterium]
MHLSEAQTKKKPPWLRVKFPSHKNFFNVSNLIKEKHLHTICQSARCPNIGECWSQKTATFLILGDRCTRGCSFCAVAKGDPLSLSADEPQKVAEAVNAMGLRYAVITSVTRDDLADGGASVFAGTVKAVREKVLRIKVEVLIPDFEGSIDSLITVIEAKPDVLNHNLEVPEALYPRINRAEKNYSRSLTVLENAHKFGATTKSGLMIGLGESKEDIFQTLVDLRAVRCDLLTIGQYLQPTKTNAPVRKYYTPQEFLQLKHIALDLGFKAVESGPLVRSSYMAHNLYQSLQKEAH